MTMDPKNSAVLRRKAYCQLRDAAALVQSAFGLLADCEAVTEEPSARVDEPSASPTAHIVSIVDADANLKPTTNEDAEMRDITPKSVSKSATAKKRGKKKSNVAGNEESESVQPTAVTATEKQAGKRQGSTKNTPKKLVESTTTQGEKSTSDGIDVIQTSEEVTTTVKKKAIASKKTPQHKKTTEDDADTTVTTKKTPQQKKATVGTTGTTVTKKTPQTKKIVETPDTAPSKGKKVTKKPVKKPTPAKETVEKVGVTKSAGQLKKGAKKPIQKKVTPKTDEKKSTPKKEAPTIMDDNEESEDENVGNTIDPPRTTKQKKTVGKKNIGKKLTTAVEDDDEPEIQKTPKKIAKSTPLSSPAKNVMKTALTIPSPADANGKKPEDESESEMEDVEIDAGSESEGDSYVSDEEAQEEVAEERRIDAAALDGEDVMEVELNDITVTEAETAKQNENTMTVGDDDDETVQDEKKTAADEEEKSDEEEVEENPKNVKKPITAGRKRKSRAVTNAAGKKRKVDADDKESKTQNKVQKKLPETDMVDGLMLEMVRKNQGMNRKKLIALAKETSNEVPRIHYERSLDRLVENGTVKNLGPRRGFKLIAT